MHSTFGIASIWQQADNIIQFVAIILLLMSIASWSIMLYKTWQYVLLKRQSRQIEQACWHCKDFEQGLLTLNTQGKKSPYRVLAEEAQSAVVHHQQNKEDLHGALPLHEWLQSVLRRSLDNGNNHQQSGLSILASVGSTAPFIGLFGTVWGIYHALISIASKGQTAIDQIAGPIGEALIMTAFGLVVAIPAVLGYNALLRSQKAFMASMNNFAHDLHAYFILGEKSSQTSRGER